MGEAAALTIGGVVRGNAVILNRQPGLPDGTHVLVTPTAPTAGTGAAILKALAESPPVSREDADELMRLIDASARDAQTIETLLPQGGAEAYNVARHAGYLR